MCRAGRRRPSPRAGKAVTGPPFASRLGRGRAAILATLCLCLLGLVTVLVPSQTSADDRVRAAVNYFQEPAPNSALIVVHPQVSYGQDYTPHFGMDVGYDADIVTGATPQIFGVDVTSAATEFKDFRNHGALGFRFMSEFATLRLGGGFAGERDYRSGTASAGVTTELFNRNTQVGIDYTHNFDRVCDAANASNQELLELRALDQSDDCFTSSDNTATRKLGIDTVELSVTQVVTPWFVLQVGGTGQVLQGFQSNPYRQVLLGTRAVQERVPETRNRMAGFARGKFALRPIKGSVELLARGYADSWALEGFTGHIAWDQYIARPLIVRARARLHVQDSVVFYRDGNQYASGGPVGEFWTGDRELSALMNTTLGLKVTYIHRAQDKQILRFMDALVISAKADLLFYRSLTENPEFSPNFERTDGFLDALVFGVSAGFDF